MKGAGQGGGWHRSCMRACFSSRGCSKDAIDAEAHSGQSLALKVPGNYPAYQRNTILRSSGSSRSSRSPPTRSAQPLPRWPRRDGEPLPRIRHQQTITLEPRINSCRRKEPVQQALNLPSDRPGHLERLHQLHRRIEKGRTPNCLCDSPLGGPRREPDLVRSSIARIPDPRRETSPRRRTPFRR